MIQLRKSTDGQYYAVIKAKNGKDLSTSETVKKKSNARKNALAIWKSCEDGKIVDKTGE